MKKSFYGYGKAGALVALLVFGFFLPVLFAESNDPRVKVLLEEALRLYSERQYVRALDLFKQVQRIDPQNSTASEYVKSSEQRIMEWESEGAGTDSKKDANWDTLLNKKRGGVADTAPNASDIIAARKSLVERMRNRSTNTDNIVQIQDTKNELAILLYHDQLFLPGLLTLRDESLPILENVAVLIRQKGDRSVKVQSVAHTNSNDPYLLFPEVSNEGSLDRSLPNMQQGKSMFFQDIEATRSMVLFTYLAQRSMGKQPKSSNE
ncbi:MAG: hypothetical protein KCHDKBKB_01967 [Elusimicrobia bacterium]|nr:hypothetical protein [Elusimicrobiota bacterium]